MATKKKEWQVTVVPPEGEMFTETLTKKPSLEFLQEKVQGYIEVAPGVTHFGGKRCIAYFNEEGQLRQMPRNHAASNICGYVVLGPLVIVH